MKKLLRFFQVALGVFCALMVLGGVIAVVQERQPVLLVLVAVFAVLAVLLLKPRKTKAAPAPAPRQESPYTPDAPEETLRDMRIYYTQEQIENDVRILSESFKLAQQTANIDTFTSRLALAQRTALTLLQAEKAGCKGILPETSKTCDQVLSSVKALKISFLENSYIKETTEAMLLKTPSGQRKRMEAYLAKLAAHKSDFLDVLDTYDKVVRETRVLMP